MTTEATRRKRFVRAAEAEHSITPIKMDMLAAIAACGYLSTPQAAAAMGMLDGAARKHLRDLFDAKLLDTIPVPGAVVGSTALMAPKVHVPTATGLGALSKLGMLGEDSSRSRVKEMSYLAHGLAVRDVFAWLARESRNNGHLLERFELSRIPPVHGVVPDAVFAYRVRDSGPRSLIAGFVEADMATERALSGPADRWARKLEAYGTAYAEKERAAVIAATGYKNPRLIVVVPTAARADWLTRRAAGSPASSRLRIAVRGDLKESGVDDLIWLSPTPDGTWKKGGFLDE